MTARPKGPLTEREIRHCAQVLSVLLPLSPQDRLNVLAIICRALWDDRLDEMCEAVRGDREPRS